ncbi:MAG: ZIP family metal transporter [Anaerolineales bacterium]|nr:ZIP family metal transporter [Anaerolineales bacterium]
MSQVLNVLLLSLIAGLGTGLGGLIAVLRRPGRRSFGLLMGITAGVMICLSFMELVNEAWEMGGFLTATVGFASGAIFMFVIDTLIPHMRFGETEAARQLDIPATTDWDFRVAMRPQPRRRGWRRREQSDGPEPRPSGRLRRHRQWLPRTSGPIDRSLLKTGVLIAVGITIHNMPEGVAVGAGYAHQPQFGYFIALAIALHNIPEGIATALPLCKGGVCKWDAFRIALLSGLTEPIGGPAGDPLPVLLPGPDPGGTGLRRRSDDLHHPRRTHPNCPRARPSALHGHRDHPGLHLCVRSLRSLRSLIFP